MFLNHKSCTVLISPNTAVALLKYIQSMAILKTFGQNVYLFVQPRKAIEYYKKRSSHLRLFLKIYLVGICHYFK
jgi:hypothetical protein